MPRPSPTLRVAAAAAVVVAFAALPSVAWRLQAPRTLEVVVVDKTVPFHNYREHAAVPWLLHAMKIQNAAGRFLDAARDYVGFDPLGKKGRDLTADDLAHADVLVLADTYGVYTGDYARPGEQAALERSPKIYGGLVDDEAHAIEDFAARGGMVIGEFNAFASPTEDRARARLEALFGVRWTKWVARYWPNLQDENEVPRWIGRLYQRAAGAALDARGGGLVFVREDADIVVLRDDEDLRGHIVTQERTPAGAVFGFPERGSFYYWMDLVEATGSEVLYEHVVDATPAGERKLAAHGLRRRFPALTRRWDAWYFAGDFVDSAMDLGEPERAWLMPYRRARAGCGGAGAEEASFWGWYAPIAARLLSSRAR
ncbi:MAG TPA: hypothetical protein VE987_14250 [Polyangiaceae bacterium]|nr:hypothetical protein [Polyangiaceae bacterium]